MIHGAVYHPSVPSRAALQAVARFVIWLVLLCPAAAAPQTPPATGTLRGTVVSAAGTDTLPHIVVELLSTDHRVAATAETDDHGAFTFADVPAGFYDVRAVVDGPAAAERVSVDIVAGTVRTISLRLGLVEQVGVTAPAAPRTAPTSSDTIAASLLDRAPLADDVRALLPLLPGIVRGSDGRIQMKGGQPTQGGYQVSGATVTDPSTGDFAFSLPSEAIESVQVLANPLAAEYGRFTSGVTELRTRRGGDRWQVTPNSFIPRFTVRRDSQWALALRSITPRVSAGGPLLGGKLSLAQSAHYRYVNTPLTALAGEPTIGLRSFDSYTRVDGTAAAGHQLTAALAVFPRTIQHAGLNAFTPFETTTNVEQRGFNAGVVHRWVASPVVVLESMVNLKAYDLDIAGTGNAPMILAPQASGGSFFNDQRRDTRSLQASSALVHARSSPWGEHLFKAGIDAMRSTYRGTTTNRPIELRGADGTLVRRIEFDGGAAQDVTGIDVALFAQDRWQITRSVSVELGARSDRDGVTRKVGIAPRAGFAVTPGGGDKTVVRGGFGVFYQRTPLNVGAFESYGTRSITDVAGGGGSPLDPPERFIPEQEPLTIPRSVIWNAGIDRRFGGSWALRVNHLRRVGSGEPIVDPQRDADGARLLLTSTGRSRYWEQEVTLRYLRSERNDMTVSYVRSRARTDLNGYDALFGNARAPIIQANEFAPSSADVPHRVLAFGTIGLGSNWDVLPVLEIRSGFPYTAVDEAQEPVGPRNGAGRFPTLATLDLTVQRHLRIGGRQIRVGLRVFNLFNRRNYRDVQNNVASPAFGQFFNQAERSLGATFWIER